MEVSNLTRKRILEYLKEDKRFDGRGLLDFRKIEIEKEISKNAEGSARVKLGNTEVVAGVKIGAGEPYTDSPDKGVLITTAELIPLASDKFEYGPPRIEAIELARIIDRGVRESGFLEFEKLYIKKGEKVYMVYLDIYPINDNGNLIDASVIACVIALLTAKMPKIDKEGNIQYGEFTSKGLPLSKNVPLTLTFHKIEDKIFLDPITEEEESSEARLSIAMSGEKPLINAVQKGNEAAFTKQEVFDIIDKAVEKWKKIYKEIMSQIKST